MSVAPVPIALERPLLILGVGNVLLQDEGVGIHLAEALELEPALLPGGAMVVDGGTLGIELLPLVADAGALLLLDALNVGAKPGTVRIFRGDDLTAAFGTRMSPHQVGAGDLLAVARLTGALPQAVALVGIQPQTIDYCLDLSAVVSAAMPGALAAARDEAWALREAMLHA
ncbi:MAG: hydrogenase maturation protease [Dehalococcoidia bacterium]